MEKRRRISQPDERDFWMQYKLQQTRYVVSAKVQFDNSGKGTVASQTLIGISNPFRVSGFEISFRLE